MRKKFYIKLTVIIFLASLFGACTKIIYNVPVYEFPPDWEIVSRRDSTIQYYSQFLKGRRIFIDPGHGGEDRNGKSRDGKIVEAEVNLRVALYLKQYLIQAGVIVTMSRETDETVDLAYRSVLANNSGADIFIGIHHNAPGKNEDNWTNYTSTYYHATENDYEYEPCNHDIAKYIERDLSYVMRNASGLGSFDGTYSDYMIYPGAGFSVLRKTKIPAVLVECSFFTSRFENLRLNDEVFNRIQAWGIFRGIGKYFRAGIPQIESSVNDSVIVNPGTELSFLLTDKSGIDPKSIQVQLDNREIPFDFDEESGGLTISISNLGKGEHTLKIICANKNGNHSFPFHKKIVIDENASLKAE